MKSENNLIITGIVISDVSPTPEQTLIRFRIAHNFGGGKKPLFLDCIQISSPGTETRPLQKGDCVRVRAYLRQHTGRIEAVVKSMDVES